MMKDSFYYKKLLVLDKERFYGRLSDKRYARLRPFLEKKLIKKFGRVYPRQTVYSGYID